MPPHPSSSRKTIGWLLRRLQRGEVLTWPHSRPMPSIGRGCHELRVGDERGDWRVVYRTDPAAVVVIHVFRKETRRTPHHEIEICRERIEDYDRRTS